MLNKLVRAAIVGLFFGVLLLTISVRGVDIGDIRAAALSANYSYVLPFIVSLGLFCWAKAIRWQLLLRPIADVSSSELMAPILIGYAGTAIVPMHLGELARAFVASRKLNLRMAATFTSIALERMLDVLTLLIVLTVALLAGATLPDIFHRIGILLGAASVGLGFGLAFYAHHPTRVATFVRMIASPLPGFIARKLEDIMLAGSDGIATLRHVSSYIRLVAISILQWSFMYLCILLTLNAFDIQLHWSLALMLVGTTKLVMLVPAGPAYLGSLQLAFVLTLAPLGIANADAIAASVFYQLMLSVPLIIAGVIATRYSGLRFRETFGQVD